MPVRLRKFIFNKLKKFYEDQSDSVNPKAPREPGKVFVPDFARSTKTDYSTTKSTKK